LQNKEIEKVGGNGTIKVDVRIVAATNQDLLKKVQEDEFREDLYYRLRVVQVPMPPLRDRREDIPLLIEHFVNLYNQRFNRQIVGLDGDAVKQMTSYAWPGNIRELQHAVEHAFVLCRDDIIGIKHLPPELHELANPQPASPQPSPIETSEGEVERIVAALEKSGWNKSRAARLLGISRRTIYRKMEELGIEDSEDVP
jgi:DNA-binding NtrC family response regulator